MTARAEKEEERAWRLMTWDSTRADLESDTGTALSEQIYLPVMHKPSSPYAQVIYAHEYCCELQEESYHLNLMKNIAAMVAFYIYGLHAKMLKRMPKCKVKDLRCQIFIISISLVSQRVDVSS